MGGAQTCSGAETLGNMGSKRKAGRGGRMGRSEHDASAPETSPDTETTLCFYPTTFTLPFPLLYVRVARRVSVMRPIPLAISCLAALCSAELNLSQPLLSKQVLPITFRPPQVFKNINLVRTTNLDKEYVRETVNVIIENIDSKPQSEYYLPFESGLLSRVGGFEVKDKKAPEKGPFKVEVVEYDSERYASNQTQLNAIC